MKDWIMRNTRWLLIFVFVFQIIGIGSVVWGYYTTKSSGKLYRFQTQPIDPRDPFRGQYVALNFSVNTFYRFQGCDNNFNRKQPLFAQLTTNEMGFATITGITATKPKGRNHIIVNGEYCGYDQNQGKLLVRLPFNRFYANEFKALDIERQARKNPESTYLNVWVDSGNYAVDSLILGKNSDNN